MQQNQVVASAQQENSETYEYRIFGVASGSYRVTEWGTRDEAESDYEKCDWGAIAIERRVAGETTTLHRKATPDDDDWLKVTSEMTHIDSEEVEA